LVEGKKVSIKLNYPFQVVADRHLITGGSPHRETDRTLSALLRQLFVYFKEHDLFDEAEGGQKHLKQSLNRKILIGAKKITNQFFPSSIAERIP
jgi:hypothetical protein